VLLRWLWTVHAARSLDVTLHRTILIKYVGPNKKRKLKYEDYVLILEFELNLNKILMQNELINIKAESTINTGYLLGNY